MIETNFYFSGGSKLNDAFRSYKMNGEDWHHIQHNLEETFRVMDTIYNISAIEGRILLSLYK